MEFKKKIVSHNNYLQHLMSYILGASWRDYFDFVFVNGDKPRWFAEDIKFKEIDTQTGLSRIFAYTKA